MLVLENVTLDVKDQDGKNKRILDNISLELDNGKFVAITGPNGGGKSTLAKVIMGIMEPTQGKVIYEGKDITNMSIKERADLGISFAFQQPIRFKGITVEDILSLAAGGKKLDKSTLCSYLTQVGLCANDYINRSVDDSLSGGEMKRIEIASLLARNTNLSIFDEPEAGIDLWSFQNLIEVFKEMQLKKGNSILIISHQERILEIADEIIVLDDGRLSRMGSGKEVLPQLLASESVCDFCPELSKKAVQ